MLKPSHYVAALVATAVVSFTISFLKREAYHKKQREKDESTEKL